MKMRYSSRRSSPLVCLAVVLVGTSCLAFLTAEGRTAAPSPKVVVTTAAARGTVSGSLGWSPEQMTAIAKQARLVKEWHRQNVVEPGHQRVRVGGGGFDDLKKLEADHPLCGAYIFDAHGRYDLNSFNGAAGGPDLPYNQSSSGPTPSAEGAEARLSSALPKKTSRGGGQSLSHSPRRRARRGGRRLRSKSCPVQRQDRLLPPRPADVGHQPRHAYSTRREAFEFDVPENTDLIFATFPGHDVHVDYQLPGIPRMKEVYDLTGSMVTLGSLQDFLEFEEEAPTGSAARTRTTSRANMSSADTITKALNKGYSLAGRRGVPGRDYLFRNGLVSDYEKFLRLNDFPNLKTYLQESMELSGDGDENSPSWSWHAASRRQGNQLMQIRADEVNRCVYTWKRLQASGEIVPVELACGGQGAALPRINGTSVTNMKDVALQRFTLSDALQWVANAPDSSHCNRRTLITTQCRSCNPTEVSEDVARVHRQQHNQNEVRATTLLRQRSFDNLEADHSNRATRAANKQLATGLAELFANVARHNDFLAFELPAFQQTRSCLEASKAFQVFRADLRSDEQIRRYMTFGTLEVKREAIEAIQKAAHTVSDFCLIEEIVEERQKVEQELQKLENIRVRNEPPGVAINQEDEDRIRAEYVLSREKTASL